MKKIIFIIFLNFFAATSFFSERYAHVSPDNALYNESIPDIPPLKISGFVLGEKKETFLKKLFKKYTPDKIRKIVVKKRRPEIALYKIDTGQTENFAFYLYDSVLGKIAVVNLRPFEIHTRIVKRFVYKYGTARYQSAPLPSYEDPRNYWYKYIWDIFYIFTPMYKGEKISVPIRIELDFSMRESFTNRVIYAYMIERKHLLTTLGYSFNR